MENTVIGYVEDFAIVTVEGNNEVYIAECYPDCFPIGTMVDEELLVPLKEVEDLEVVEMVNLFLEEREK